MLSTYASQNMIAQKDQPLITGLDKVLDVPYHIQPNAVTCQSSCLKMYASYLQTNGYTFPAADDEIIEIHSELGSNPERPNKEHRNTWTNFLWWLNQHNAENGLQFNLEITDDQQQAIVRMINSIDNGFPVLLSTNHARVKGHIIMVVGYVNHFNNEGPTTWNEGLQFVCHDPYGEFHPELLSNLYRNNRYKGSFEEFKGGQYGPGKGVLLSIDALKRMRSDQHTENQYVMISAAW